MSNNTIHEMRERVCGHTLVCRTGILLMPKSQLRREIGIANQLNLEPINYQSWLQERIPNGAKFVRLTHDRILQDIDSICSTQYRFNCVFLYNLDLALAYLEFLERPYVWEFLRDKFKKRPSGLIVAMPEQAHKLLPTDTEQEIWWRGKRIARLTAERT